MGGPSPKQSDYQATRSEKMSADIAKQKADFFSQNYMPVMKAQLGDAEMDMTGTIEGRANADIAQAVDNSGMAYDEAVTGRAQEELMRAKTQAGGAAASRALAARNSAGTNILGAVQGQQDIVGQSRQTLANLDTQELLSDNQNRMDTRNAAINAGAQLATAAILRRKKNQDAKNAALGKTPPAGSAPGVAPMVPVFQQPRPNLGTSKLTGFSAPSSFNPSGFNPNYSATSLGSTSTTNPFQFGR